MPETFIKITGLHFAHDNGTKVFNDVNLEIQRGNITAILGPSGTGKTTLLRLLSGQLIPTHGKIEVDGQIVNQLSHQELYVLRKQMGMLFQSGGLFTHLSVFENVAFPLREHTNLSESLLKSVVKLKLQMVGLRGASNLMPNELSGGMARRVALARSLALDPKIVLYDEPFTGQDPISMGILMTLIKTLNSVLKMTSILVSHDVQETLKIADYVYVISDRRIIGQGTPEEIANGHEPELQQFIQGLPNGPVQFDYPALALEEDFLG